MAAEIETARKKIIIVPEQSAAQQYHCNFGYSGHYDLYDVTTEGKWLFEYGEGKKSSRRAVIFEWNSTINLSTLEQSVNELSQIILDKKADLRNSFSPGITIAFDEFEDKLKPQTEYGSNQIIEKLVINNNDTKKEYWDMKDSEAPLVPFVERKLYRFHVSDAGSKSDFQVIFNRRDPYPVRPLLEFPKSKRDSEELWNWAIDHHVNNAEIRRKGVSGKDIAGAIPATIPINKFY